MTDAEATPPGTESEWTDVKALLERWGHELQARVARNVRAAQQVRCVNGILSTFNVIFAAVTATTVFSVMNRKIDQLDWPAQILVTAVAVLPAISSGLQGQFKLATREAAHSAIAADSIALGCEIEALLAIPPAPSELPKAVKTITEQMGTLIRRPILEK